MDLHGKNKAVTFSFDDGVTQDRRLVRLFDDHGLKCTFNLDSALFGKTGTSRKGEMTTTHNKIEPDEVAALYKNHEVAGHTLTHPHLTELSDDEVVREIEEDRAALSRLSGQDVIGFAYPYGAVDDRVAGLIRARTGVRYARAVRATHAFDLPEDPILLDPTIHAVSYDETEALCRQFIELEADRPQVLYIWGHSYEFDFDDGWTRFERICRLIAGRADIAYVTNRELFE